jgi:hypothetical protein
MSQSYLVSPLADPVAGIIPMRFVYLDPSNAFTVLQAASATAHPIAGIAQPGTRTLPWVETDTNCAGLPSENIMVFDDEKDVNCMIESGGVISPGDWLTSDSVGRGITTTSTGNQVGAQAKSGATAAGQFIPVTPARFVY